MFTARGTEDPATGAANCALLGLLASRRAGGGTLRAAIAQVAPPAPGSWDLPPHQYPCEPYPQR